MKIGMKKSWNFLKKYDAKNHQCRSDYSRMSGSTGDSDLEKSENYGACAALDGRLNCSNILGVTPFVMIFWSIFIGSRALSRAVLIIVMAIDTLFLPFFVIFPNGDFSKKERRFLIILSAKLFVGFIVSGYFKKIKSFVFKCYQSFADII